MGLLQDKVVLITGGARGQGRAHALTSAHEGADVVLFDIVAQLGTVPYELPGVSELESTVAEVEALGRRAIAVVGDVRSQADLDAAVVRALQEFGKVDVLIANAGIWVPSRFWDLSDEQWDETVGTNMTGVWKAAKAVAPHMIERESGSIVVTSSMNGLEGGVNNASYTAAKHGVLGLMKCIALELAPYGIRCNAVCPGAINTPMTNNPGAWALFAGHKDGTEAEMLESGHAYHALKGRGFLPPTAVADAALFLNSDLADSITGAILPVDAGHMLLPGVNRRPS